MGYGWCQHPKKVKMKKKSGKIIINALPFGQFFRTRFFLSLAFILVALCVNDHFALVFRLFDSVNVCILLFASDYLCINPIEKLSAIHSRILLRVVLAVSVGRSNISVHFTFTK